MSIKSFASFIFTCAVAVVFVLTTASSGQAQECGDVNENGEVTAADALSVLQAAVGMGALSCRTGDFVALEAAVAANAIDITTLEASSLPCASQVGDDVIFDGCNVHVRSGAGTTDAAVNGLGNLIVGYDEDGGFGADGEWGTGDDKTGSHNLVVGREHTYSSYGGLVAGRDNNVSGNDSSVSGGHYNTASGDRSSVSGGRYNTASGYQSSVSGGSVNTASGYQSSVSGGSVNTASGDRSSVSGGHDNTASGNQSSVSGGYENTASGYSSSVSGGLSRSAAGDYYWVAGALLEDF